MTGTMQVFFDSRCPLCSREIEYYQRLAPDAPIQWVDLFAVEPERLPASRDQLLRVIHGRDDQDRLITGVDVFVEMWSRLPGMWPWLGRFARLPLVNWLARKTYALFARRRYRKLYCSIN